MVLDVVHEQVPELRLEGVVGLDLDVAAATPERDAPRAEGLVVRQFIDFAHEPARVETQCVVAFLEFVEFLDDGDRNHQVVVLELPDGLVVVEDDVRVQHEDLRLFLSPFFHGSVFSFGGLCV